MIERLKRFILILAGGIVLAAATEVPLALADCPKGEALCPSNLGGGCAPLGNICCPGGTHVAVGGACAGENTGSWGAVAVAQWNDSSGNAQVEASINYNSKTLSQASAAALTNCQKTSGQLCHIVGTFDNGGCGYVAVGTGRNNARYGMSATAEGATKECTATGDACKAPIGGCTTAQ